MATAKRTTYVAVIVLLAVLGAYTYAMRYRRIERPAPPAFELIPGETGGYTGVDDRVGEGQLDILGADATLARTYRRPGHPTVWLFIAYFGDPQENSQIHSPKHCYPGAGWSILEEGKTAVLLTDRPCVVKHLVISNGVERQFVLYWFLGAEGVIRDEFALKWSQMKSALLGRPRETAFVRFSTRLGADEDPRDSVQALARFAAEVAPGIERALGRGAGRRPEAVTRRNDS